MWKSKRGRKKLGMIIGSIGIGIIATFILPLWAWIIAVGGGLIYAGWYLIKENK